MVKIIQQETFDTVVRENIEEFGLSAEEAIEDAEKQFIAQGIDLSNIIKDLYLRKDEDPLLVALERIKDNIGTSSTDGLEEAVENLKNECRKDIARKILAGKKGAYNLLLNVLTKFKEDKIQVASLAALVALMTGYPDLLDAEGLDLMINKLEDSSSEQQQILTLQWAVECCKKHENNRQSIFKKDITTILKRKIEDSSSSRDLLYHICCLFRHLVLDDDVRVEFSQAHEHARTISSDNLSHLTKLLFKLREDNAAVCELLQTLTSLIVRNEFCQEVADCGGLTFIMDAMTEFPNDEKLNWQCLRLLKGLAGNDEVKLKIMQSGGGALIISCMDRFKNSINISRAGLAVITALCLRSPQNSQLMCELEAPSVIVQAMKIHSADSKIQKSGCCAVRNVVSRCRELSKHFLELGIEEIINDVMKRFKSELEFDAKSALRDLGCNVVFKEEWKGENKSGVIDCN
ncbi:unnamed protein product [Bemisia tabaci]|uniref:LRRK2 ARM repeat domain-containing protein n=1 Tax=Bemisia tabaci TaxID=7038 RepID=A0A9P0AHP5_BEMTA|nr:unnamed protein product [Bemisia tabaci]